MVSKDDVPEVSILWLREDADTRDPTTFACSGLEQVLVLNALRSDHSLVWVCLLTSTILRRAKSLRLLEWTTKPGRECKECGHTHTLREGLDNKLRYDEAVIYQDTRMHKKTHIRVETVYEISLRMLDFRSQNTHIDPVSLSHVENMAEGVERLSCQSYAMRRSPEDVGSFPVEVRAAFMEQGRSRTDPLPMNLIETPELLEIRDKPNTKALINVQPGDMLSLRHPNACKEHSAFEVVRESY